MNEIDKIISHIEKDNVAPGKCLISFSGGKDAWSCWIALRDKMETTLYAYYLVPKLEVVDEYLDYCERKTGQKIHRYPSPFVYDRLTDLHYQPPERVGTIDAANLPKLDFDAISRAAELDAGLPANMWTATGVRAADSISRASAIKAHGAWNDKRRIFYPVWDWKKEDVIGALRSNHIRLSREYLSFGRTFDGLFLLYALGLKRDYPRDYARVLEMFPFVELEVFRYEKALETYGGADNLPKNIAIPEKNTTRPSRFSFAKATAPKKEDKYSVLNAESKKVDAKMQSMVFPDFWISVYFPDGSRFQVVFEDPDQRDFLLKQTKLFSHGDKYLDGRYVAAKLGIKGFQPFPRFQKNKQEKNPMAGFEYTNNIEADCYLEFDSLIANMPSQLQFSGSQAEDFLKKAGWPQTDGNCWGHDIASALGFQFSATSYYYRPTHRLDRKLEALV